MRLQQKQEYVSELSSDTDVAGFFATKGQLISPGKISDSFQKIVATSNNTFEET
jgi:hypothetical protein